MWPAAPTHLTTASWTTVFGRRMNNECKLYRYRHSPTPAPIQNHAGQLPLHMACSGGAPVEVIQCLLDAFLEGCKQEEYNGSLPLHVACKYKDVDLEVVRCLVERFPASVSWKDQAGCLPIHWACKEYEIRLDGTQGVNLEVINYLAQQYPASLMTVDNNGSVPFKSHFFCFAIVAVAAPVMPLGHSHFRGRVFDFCLCCIWTSNEAPLRLHCTFLAGESY
jgi:hypothetical protein